MSKHDAPDVREYCIPRDRHDVEYDEQEQVEEEEYVSEDLERDRVVQIGEVVKEN